MFESLSDILFMMLLMAGLVLLLTGSIFWGCLLLGVFIFGGWLIPNREDKSSEK